MKEIIANIILIFMSVLILKAQNEKKLNFLFPLENINKTIIIVNDNLEIENTTLNNVECELRSIENGKVLGISNKDELKDPNLVTEIKDSVLYIFPEKRESLYVIGVSTYRQDLMYRFKIPSSIPVEIKNDSKCYVNGSFNNLVIENEDETELYVVKDHIKYLNCIASINSVTLNGTDKGMHYFYESTGNARYIIKSGSISIQFK